MSTKIAIKYAIPNIIFEQELVGEQSFSVYYKKTSDTDWILLTANYTTDANGNNTSETSLTGLTDDIDYDIKFIHNTSKKEYITTFHTCYNFSVGESPLYLKKLFPGQSFSWYISGLANEFIPNNYGGWFYDLTGKMNDKYGGFSSLETPNGISWTSKATTDNADEVYLSFTFDSSKRILTFPVTNTNTDANIYAESINGGGFFMKFYLSAGATNIMLLDMINTDSPTSYVKIGIDSSTLIPYMSSSSGADQTVNFDNALSAGKWYTLEYIIGSSIKILASEGTVVSTGTCLSNVFANKITKTPIYIGEPDGSTTGLNVCKLYFDPHSQATETDISKLTAAYKYVANLIFSKSGSSGGGTVFAPNSYIKLGDASVSSYFGNSNRSNIVLDLAYTTSGINTDNAVKLRVNCYLYQYAESTTYTLVTQDIVLQSGTNTSSVTFQNKFAYRYKLDFELILSTGTTTEDFSLLISSITDTIAAAPLSIKALLEDSSSNLLKSDSVNGSFLALATISVDDTKGTLSISFAALSSGDVTTQDVINPMKYLMVVDDSKITATIDPDLTTGVYELKCKAANTGVLGSMQVEVVSVDNFVDKNGFDIDFTGDFDSAMSLFFEKFSANHTQWGGYNGGCNGNLIYGNRKNKSLIFEQHGDNYAGEVVGVAKPAMDSTYKGYGIPAKYTANNDPQKGKDRLTRVGSIVVSNNYFGFGKFDITIKIPSGTYGVCLAMWLFHYIELFPYDPRWNGWIDRGGKPYGGADPYMVINNEIDIELPSHNVNGTFASWNELASAYFDPNAIDTQYMVGVQDSSSTDKYGTFKLVDTSKPNEFASWKKVSSTIEERNVPSFKACKFNNWRGEKSSGNGWAYTKSDYEGEEYLALLTELTKNYADDTFHKWTITWYKDKTELYIDDVLVRTNKAFVPFNVMRLTLGGWFPSPKEEKYTPEAPGTWAGIHADFSTLNFEVQAIKFTPFSDTDAGGTVEENAESYPEAGLRTLS